MENIPNGKNRGTERCEKKKNGAPITTYRKIKKKVKLA
jgi:hypothetical protein